MASETEVLIICGAAEESAPGSLKIFLDLFEIMLKKITGLSPRFRYVSGLDPMEIAAQIHPNDIAIAFLYPALIESGKFMFTLTAIMDKMFAGGSDDAESGLLVLFTDQSNPRETAKIVLEYLPGVRMRYDLGLVQSLDQGGSNERDMFDCLLDLAYGIRMHKEKKQNKKDDKGKPAIFLAETTPDAEHYHQSLKNELETLGYRILSPGTRLENEEQAGNLINEFLGKSFLSLHLIGRAYGAEVPATGRPLVELQVYLSAEYAAKNEKKQDILQTKRMIWIMPSGKSSDARQEKVISHIKQESLLFLNSELLETPFESLKTYLHKYLVGHSSEEKAEAQKTPGKANLFLIYEKKATERLKPLISWLEQEKLSYSHPIFNAAPEETMPYYRKMLASCDDVVVFFSGENYIWLKTKVNDILKAPGYGRQEPFHSRIVLAPGNFENLPGEQFEVLKYAESTLTNEVFDTLKSILHHA
jgi:hypothetical protein